MSADGPDFIVFVDESGDHGLETIDPGYPAFVLAFCIVQKSDYSRVWLPAVTEFKFRHFGHDQVILHERDIRKDSGDFAMLRDRSRKQAFIEELTTIVESLPMTVVATVIHKAKLVGTYVRPSNPYEIALRFGLERVQYWLARRQPQQAVVPVILECRGKKEDDQLELEFRRICDGSNATGGKLSLEPRFVKKAANVPGLQIADLIARPIGRHVCWIQGNRIGRSPLSRRRWTKARTAQSTVGV